MAINFDNKIIRKICFDEFGTFNMQLTFPPILKMESGRNAIFYILAFHEQLEMFF